MLGHKLCQTYNNRFETWVTTHSAGIDLAKLGICDPKHVISRVDFLHFDAMTRAVRDADPDVIVNCIGIIKQSPRIRDVIETIELNSVFPHKLALLAKAMDARLIHISTDCVFSGRKGMCTENDISDAEDLYGRTKFLGEVQSPGCLTLRTSIIGRELNSAYGLLEWFLSQRNSRVKGYTRAIYSGFTTQALAAIIEDIMLRHPSIEGLYNVSSDPITKYELLKLLN
jgi:dTDP-4-dehydrorhamnose reductase